MTHHHKLIKALVAEIRSLRETTANLNEALSYADEAASRARSRARQQVEEAESQARRDHEEMEYRDSQRERVMRDLERAKRYGDEYGINQAVDRLRRI